MAKTMPSKVLEVGTEKDIEAEGWTGKVTRKGFKKIHLVRKLQALSNIGKTGTSVDTMVALYDFLDEVFPKVDLSFEGVKFSTMEDLFDASEGQKFMTDHLTKAAQGAGGLEKN